MIMKIYKVEARVGFFLMTYCSIFQDAEQAYLAKERIVARVETEYTKNKHYEMFSDFFVDLYEGTPDSTFASEKVINHADQFRWKLLQSIDIRNPMYYEYIERYNNAKG